MIVYIGFAQPDEWPHWAAIYAVHAQRLEEASNDACLTVPYRLAGSELMDRLDPWAVVMSGFARSFEAYSAGELAPVTDWLLHGVTRPTLAICGSHQLLGCIFGNDTAGREGLRDRPMRPHRPGEPITNADYHPDYFMEKGFYELELVEDDPLFAQCARPPLVLESHYCEIKTLPPEFRLLASTPECRIQAMRHRGRPLIGVQFHPEDYTERFADGRCILQAFFREAAECME